MTHKSPSAINAEKALSNLKRQCSELKTASLLSPAACLYQASHRLEMVDSYLAAYAAAGEDVKFLPLAEKLCDKMLTMVVSICDEKYWEKRPMSTITYEVMKSVIDKVIELTEMVDEPDYGLNAADTFNAFVVNMEDLTQETKYAPKG